MFTGQNGRSQKVDVFIRACDSAASLTDEFKRSRSEWSTAIWQPRGMPFDGVSLSFTSASGSQQPSRPGKARQTKVAEATTEPDELTSFAPRRLPMSTWIVRENCPLPPWRWKAPTATVEPFSTWSLHVIGPL